MDAVTGAPPLRRVPSLRQVSRVADADASSMAEMRAGLIGAFVAPRGGAANCREEGIAQYCLINIS